MVSGDDGKDSPGGLPGTYTPMISEEHAQRIRRWHESAYEAGRAEGATTQTFTYLGATLVVPPGVMPITRMSHLLGEAILAEVRDGDRVLDMGTGSGVNAILAASKRTQVVAVDINPRAVEAACANTERNGVADRVEVRQSDVFSNADGEFDLIIFDPPFRWFRPRDLLEAAMADEDYHSLTAFFLQAKVHLSESGRMLVFFGSSGDLAYLQHLIDEQGFAAQVVAQDDLIKDGWRVEYFTFRLTK